MEEQKKILVFQDGDAKYHIEIGQSYQVIGKFDPDAPDGFQKMRTTKVLDPDVVDSVNLAVFDADKGTYDTGLTKNSKALFKLYKGDVDAIDTHLRNINKILTNRLLDIKGNIEPNNYTLWDEFREDELGMDKVFNTNDVIQLYKLYALILQGKLAPVGFESKPYFKTSASFAVENKKDVVNVSQKREFDKAKAQAKFFTLLEEDKSSLFGLLDMIGIKNISESDESLLVTVFNQWINKDENQNPKKFLETYKDFYISKSGREFLGLYNEVKRLEKEGVIQRKMAGLFLGEVNLGKTTELATHTISKDKDLLDKVYKTIDAE